MKIRTGRIVGAWKPFFQLSNMGNYYRLVVGPFFIAWYRKPKY
jgi:hypothetical protein